MSIYSARVSVPLHWAILIIFITIILVFAGLFVFLNPERQWLTPEGYVVVIVSGLVPGLVVALIQYLLQWGEYKELSRLRGMKIRNVLISRDDEDYYRDLIQAAATRIDVLGVTCTRLLADFALDDSPKPGKKALLDALGRGVEVRILIAKSERLPAEDANEKHPRAIRRLRELEAKYPRQFQFRLYDHEPSQTIFLADNECLVGPKFPKIASRNTPTIHSVSDGAFSKPYLRKR